MAAVREQVRAGQERDPLKPQFRSAKRKTNFGGIMHGMNNFGLISRMLTDWAARPDAASTSGDKPVRRDNDRPQLSGPRPRHETLTSAR